MLTDPTSNADVPGDPAAERGLFQLDDDQALVITIDPGNAGYFVVPVTNDWTITDNYWDQQTSLNNAHATQDQAEPGRDLHDRGLAEDPGVCELGVDRRPEPGHDLDPVPGPRSGVVGLADRQLAGGIPGRAGRVLPPNTVYATPQDRLDQIALRKAGFDKRFAPYPQP